MKREFVGPLKARFNARVAQKLPQFRQLPGQEIPSTAALYECKVDSELSFFVLMVPNPKSYHFWVELVWSTNGRYPPGGYYGEPDEEPDNGDLKFDIGEFWGEEEFQWELKNQSKWTDDFTEFEGPATRHAAKIYPHVDDAIERVREYGIPYFAKIAKRYGKTFPSSP